MITMFLSPICGEISCGVDVITKYDLSVVVPQVIVEGIDNKVSHAAPFEIVIELTVYHCIALQISPQLKVIVNATIKIIQTIGSG